MHMMFSNATVHYIYIQLNSILLYKFGNVIYNNNGNNNNNHNNNNSNNNNNNNHYVYIMKSITGECLKKID